VQQNVLVLNSGDHPTGAQSFDQEDERHDRNDVVVGREWRQPMHGKVPYPDDEDRHIDREYPKHEN
jgi:hypothetical protein